MSCKGAEHDDVFFSRRVDPRKGEMLENLPQAFSHVNPIKAASAITQAQQGTGSTQAPPRQGD